MGVPAYWQLLLHVSCCLQLAAGVPGAPLGADNKCASDSDCCQLFGDKQECGNAGKCVSSRPSLPVFCHLPA